MLLKVLRKEFKENSSDFVFETVKNIVRNDSLFLRDNFKGEVSSVGDLLVNFKRFGINTESLLLGLMSIEEILRQEDISKEQIAIFYENVSNEISKEDDFNKHLMFVCVLEYIDNSELYLRELSKFAEKIKFDKSLLRVMVAVSEEYLNLNKILRDRMIIVLREDKLIINMDEIFNLLSKKDGLIEYSEFAILKSFNKILKLKAGDFKGLPDKLEAIKRFRDIGTSNCDFNKIKDAIGLTPEEYYALSIKICNESYKKGTPRELANRHIFLNLNRNLGVSTNNLDRFLKIVSIDNQLVGISKEVNLSEYKDTSELYGYIEDLLINKNQFLPYRIVSALIEDEKFFEILERYLEKTDDKLLVSKFILTVIDNEYSEKVKRKYFSIIEKYKIKIRCVDIDKLMNLGYITLDKIFSEESIYIKEFDNVITKIYDNNFKDFLNNEDFLKFARLFYIEGTGFKRLTLVRNRRFYSNLSKIEYRLKLIYQDESVDKDIRIDALKMLEKYMFAFSNPENGNLYAEFIIENIGNEFFNEVMNINEDSLKEIVGYIISNISITSSVKEKLERFLISEEEYMLNKEKSNLENLLDRYYRRAWKNSHIDIISYIEDSTNRETLKSYMFELISLWEFDYNGVGLFTMLILSLCKKGLISEVEKKDIIENRLKSIEETIRW